MSAVHAAGRYKVPGLAKLIRQHQQLLAAIQHCQPQHSQFTAAQQSSRAAAAMTCVHTPATAFHDVVSRLLGISMSIPGSHAQPVSHQNHSSRLIRAEQHVLHAVHALSGCSMHGRPFLASVHNILSSLKGLSSVCLHSLAASKQCRTVVGLVTFRNVTYPPHAYADSGPATTRLRYGSH